MKLEKSEKLLLAIGLFMGAFIVGYNAFFVPEAGTTTIVQSEKVENSNNTQTESLPEESVNSSDNVKSTSESNTDSSKTTSRKSDNKTNFSGLVNINKATQDELSERLKGIGTVVAKRIVDYREKNGGFSTIEELKNVKGIGDKVFEKIKDTITVN